MHLRATLNETAKQSRHRPPRNAERWGPDQERWTRLIESADDRTIWRAIGWNGCLERESAVDDRRPSDAEFKMHFEALFRTENHYVLNIDTQEAPFIPLLDEPFTPREIGDAIKCTKNKSFIGVCAGLLRWLPANWIDAILHILNRVFTSAQYPEAWQQNRLILQAFRRFCARRGCPSHVYSDNASTFKGADTLIRKVMAHSAPEWHFIVPGSPWWGGFWERLVRSVKTALRKSVGGAHLSHAELETVLQEIESCINSRPLTHVDSDLVLTPAHFLTGRLGYVKLNLAPSPSLHVMGEDLEQLHLAREKCLNVFWTKWTNEYLKGLPHLVSRFKRHGAPKIGSIVLIKEDNVPRFRWPLGVIEDIFPGRDGLVRALRIRTQTGVYTRPLQKVFDLEMCCAPKDVPPSELQGESVELQARSDDSQTTRFFRPRRTIRPPDRLDL